MEETEKPQLGSAVQADLPKEVPSKLRLKERDEVTREQSWRNSLPGGEPGAPANAASWLCQVHKWCELRESLGSFGLLVKE